LAVIVLTPALQLAGWFHLTTAADAQVVSTSQPAIPAKGRPVTRQTAATSRPATTVDQELVRKLLGGQASSVDAVESTLSEMERAAVRLTESMDTGLDTQKVQGRVIAGLDRLIEQARRNRAAAKPGKAMRRAAERRPRPSPSQGKRPAEAAPNASKEQSRRAAEAPGAGEREGLRRADKAELSRGWGYLPLREREEIAQGFDDDFLPKYREQIIRYYQDLARGVEGRQAVPAASQPGRAR